MQQPIDTIQDLIGRHCRAPRQATAVPGLTLFRLEAPTQPVRSLYDPRLCIVLRGRKRVALGDRTFEIGPGELLIVTVDLPVSASVIEASPDQPHLALTLDLGRAQIADLLLRMSPDPPSSDPSAGLALGSPSDDLLDPVARLVGLLDRPGDIEVIAPIVEREIHYRLLQGEHGSLLRQFATAGTHLSRVARAIAWIRAHYAEPMTIELLAGEAGMSTTSLHRHFKAVTMMTPLQYRTRIRLQEARRRLLVEGRDAGAIGFDVGYDSASQFSREYRRMFGRPPSADIAGLRRPDGQSTLS